MDKCLLIVAALALASPVFAQTAPPPVATSKGIWIDVNLISLTPAQGQQSYTFTSIDSFGEPSTFTANYPAMPTAVGVGISVGYQAKNGVGYAVYYTPAKYTYTTGLSVRIPSPAFFNTYGSDTGVTNGTLERKDHALDLSITYAPKLPHGWSLRGFGGPTYFSVSQEMVSDIRYHQVYNVFLPINTVDITSYDTKTVTGSGWGFHAGIDVAFFFAKHFGVGGGFRTNLGNIDVTDPLSETTVTLKMGGVTIGGGLRMRF